jgi:hypothetical protein
MATKKINKSARNLRHRLAHRRAVRAAALETARKLRAATLDLRARAALKPHKCKQNADGKHTPDPRTVQYGEGTEEADGSFIIDVWCSGCGRSGSVRIDANEISFD